MRKDSVRIIIRILLVALLLIVYGIYPLFPSLFYGDGCFISMAQSEHEMEAIFMIYPLTAFLVGTVIGSLKCFPPILAAPVTVISAFAALLIQEGVGAIWSLIFIAVLYLLVWIAGYVLGYLFAMTLEKKQT